MGFLDNNIFINRPINIDYRRGITNDINDRRKRVKSMIYAHKLRGLSSNANDLFRYIQEVISKRKEDDEGRYIIYLGNESMLNFANWLDKNNPLSLSSLNKVKAELIKRNAIIPLKNNEGKHLRGNYIYNFKEFGYIGSWQMYCNDLNTYADILGLTNKQIKEEIDSFNTIDTNNLNV